MDRQLRKTELPESVGWISDRCTIPILSANLICTKTLIPMAVYHIRKGKNVLETEFCYAPDGDSN